MNKEYNINNLRNRFVNDLKLPIQVIQSPYFEERLKQIDNEYNCVKAYSTLCNIIKNQFQDNIQLFLDNYYATRDNIITSLSSTDAYKNFINDVDLNNYSVSKYNFPNKNIYSSDCVGKTLLSIDLKKANFQALKYVDRNIILNSETYEDMIKLFTTSEYIINSKYIREVIFGQLNPKRHIVIEKYLLSLIYEYIRDNGFLGALDGELICVNSDELIYEVNLNNYNVNDICTDIIAGIKEEVKLDVKCVIFTLQNITFKLSNSSKLTIYKKINL